jgi:fructosamine-3-kinase
VGYILYGVSEFFFGVRFYRFRRLYEAELERMAEVREAEAVEVTEVVPVEDDPNNPSYSSL